MQHSLRHRFRGALVGAALGETLGINCRTEGMKKSSATWLAVQQWGFAVPASSAKLWSNIAAKHSDLLIQGRIREEGRFALASFVPPDHQNNRAGMAITTLPIALFYHEDWYQLRDLLEQIALHGPTPLPLSSVLTVAYTISLALRERLHLHTLIPRLITDLELYDRDPQLMQQLNQVQSWVQEGTDIVKIRSLIQAPCLDGIDPAASTPVAVALYGFLNTPTDFRLSLLRTAQVLYHPQVTCAIVSTLSGAYNSIAGIPLAWRRALSSPVELRSQRETSSLETPLSEAELLRQADLLWATWSGADNPTDWLQQSSHPIIASPHLIRPRY